MDTRRAVPADGVRALAQVDERLIRTAHSFFPPRWVVRGVDPTQPFMEIQSLDAMMLDSVGMQRFYLVVLSAFAVFAVLLAGVGIYAAHSYLIASRRAETGVRLAPREGGVRR